MGSKAGLTQIFQNQYLATGTQLPVPSTQQNQIVIPNCAEGAVRNLLYRLLVHCLPSLTAFWQLLDAVNTSSNAVSFRRFFSSGSSSKAE